MPHLATPTWVFSAVWQVLRLFVYFSYGYWKSRLRIEGQVEVIVEKEPANIIYAGIGFVGGLERGS